MKCTAKNPWKCTVRVCTCGFFAAPAAPSMTRSLTREESRRALEELSRSSVAPDPLERGLREAEDARRRRETASERLRRVADSMDARIGVVTQAIEALRRSFPHDDEPGR